jgi:primosomal protein N' (replication factor Y)
MKYLEVAVAAPIDHSLTYLPLPDSTTNLVPGLRLLVPLGGRLATGYLLATQPLAGAGIARDRLRTIAAILDETPLFPGELVPFFRWIADYYHYPIGQVVACALPGGLTVKSGRRAALTEAGRHEIAELQKADADGDRPWLAHLLATGFLSAAVVRQLWQTNDRRLLNAWQSKGWLEVRQSVPGSRVKTKTELFVVPADSLFLQAGGQDSSADLKPSERKTLDVLAGLLGDARFSACDAVARRELTRIYPGAGRALTGLAVKKIINLVEKPVYRDPFGQRMPYRAAPEKLTAEQTAALNRLLPCIAEKKYVSFLLHGITGSGKTEVYLQAAAATIRDGRSVLVLVPEIALATQLEGYFFSRFGGRVALLHSGLTPGELYDQWQRIMHGEATVVIGARSAVFAPLQNIGLIVVDEEHDTAYKQEEGFRYHARDLAVLRASMSRCVVVLGSATPSVSSYYHAKNGKYERLVLQHRIAERPLPTVQIVDLRAIKTISGRPPLFSPQLIAALKENLSLRQQSLVFLNRRGYANMVLCNDCGQNLQCRNCHITLTLHKGSGRLLCHYCGYSTSSNLICPTCASGNIIQVGFGTERIEYELATLFPAARLARLDRDTCGKRQDYLRVLKAMHDGQVDILIGTQMIAKGHDFPNVTLVGIVWADAGLGMPDFRAGERTFQLLTQVTGRAGRGGNPGRVVVQTHQPEHYSVALARRHDYATLYEKEITLRKELGYPPFTRMINLRIEGIDETAVRNTALALARSATICNKQAGPVKILGPAPAPLTRLRGKFRWQLLLLGTEREVLHTLCSRLMQHGLGRQQARGVKVSVDVDPENLL